MKRPKLRVGRKALVVVALFLASSGALRLGDGLGQAWANAADKEETADAPQTCSEPPLALAQALSVREAEVSAKESAVAERMAALSLADEAITKRLSELEAAEAELKKTLALADNAAEDDLLRLTAVYEAMKPSDAAALFQTMAPEFAAGFLGRMRPEAAAAVISGMTPESAYSISVLIAGRNALVPKS